MPICLTDNRTDCTSRVLVRLAISVVCSRDLLTFTNIVKCTWKYSQETVFRTDCTFAALVRLTSVFTPLYHILPFVPLLQFIAVCLYVKFGMSRSH